MNEIALVYSSRTGQTAKIVRYMEGQLQARGFSTQLIDASTHLGRLDSNVDAVIIGCPVYRGQFLRPLVGWVRSHKSQLRNMPTAFFSVTLNAADKRDSARVADRELHRLFIRKTGLVPKFLGSLAGALKYRSYWWVTRLLMARISRSAGGDTDTTQNFEYTDWKLVDHFLQDFTIGDQSSQFHVHRVFPSEFTLNSQMPEFEHHWVMKKYVKSDPDGVFRVFHSMGSQDARLARVLGKVRTLGAADLPNEKFLVNAERFGSIPLPSSAPHELIAGLVGRFWNFDFGIRKLKPEEFWSFNEPGFTKVLTSFDIVPVPGTSDSIVRAEMRIHSTSADAKRKFRIYWTLLRPGIGLYMRSILEAVRRNAERSPNSTKDNSRDLRIAS